MDRKFTLDNMTYEDNSFSTEEKRDVVYNTYKYTFPNGHELLIYITADGERWRGNFYSPEKDQCVEIGLRNSPKAVLGAFLKDLEAEKFPPEMMENFVMWEEDLEDPEEELLNYEEPQE